MKFYLKTEDHGGDCCGIKHLYGFDCVDLDDDWYENKSDRISFFDKIEVIGYYVGQLTNGHGTYFNGPKQFCIEVSLNQEQWKDWERAIQRCGFRKGFEFTNSNHGNRIRIYFLAVNPPTPVKQMPVFKV